jgi:hypothetical protein
MASTFSEIVNDIADEQFENDTEENAICNMVVHQLATVLKTQDTATNLDEFIHALRYALQTAAANLDVKIGAAYCLLTKKELMIRLENCSNGNISIELAGDSLCRDPLDFETLQALRAVQSIAELSVNNSNSPVLPFKDSMAPATTPRTLQEAMVLLSGSGVGPDPFEHFYNEIKKRSCSFRSGALSKMNGRYSDETRQRAIEKMVDFGWLIDNKQRTTARNYTKTANFPS